MELRLVEKQITTTGREDWWHGRIGWRVCNQGIHRLAFVRSEGSDVNEPDNLWIITRLSDHRSAIRVAHENYWAILGIDNEVGCRHIARQRNGRILNYRHVVIILLENIVDTLPTRAVDKAAVNEHDIFSY